MLVSIIVPVYNTAAYLDKCIESLLNQSYEKIEIILVNDGSKDSSLEICKRYELQESRIVVVDKENGGASSARNAGLAVASGEYVMFVDSDDYVANDYVKEMIMAQLEHQKALVICDLCGILSDGSYWPFHETLSAEGILKISEYYEFSKWLLLNQPYNKIFSSNVIKDRKLSFREDLPIGEDIYFNLEYLQFCKGIYFVNKELYFCLRDRDGSLCHREYKNLMDIYTLVFEKHKELFELFGVDNVYEKALLSNHYGEHIDCLERAMMNSKCKRDMYAKMKGIMGSRYFQLCLDTCKKDIPTVYYHMLRVKSPRIYYWYSQLSKLR